MSSVVASRHGQRLLATISLLASLLALAACGRVAPVIKVGLVAPFEGRHRAVGYDVIYSARLAVREINAAGGINGTRVALVALDDGSDPETAAAVAESLALDPGVVAVVGHWLPETTTAGQAVYDQSNLPFVAGGRHPFAAADPARLSKQFVTAYTAVTPFDEQPGPYAVGAYDAFQLLWRAMAAAQADQGRIDRATVQAALEELQ